MLVSAERLRKVAQRILGAMGSDAAEAVEVGDHLVEANLRGHDSHGIGMFPMYVRSLRNGLLFPNRHAELVHDSGALARFSGGLGHGQVVAREVTDWAIERAKSSGVAIAGLCDVHHIGRVGTYGERACAAGTIFIGFVSGLGAPPIGHASFRGSDGRMTSNPICIAIPTGDRERPFVLDFATSAVAIGKIRVAFNESRKLPPGVLIDRHGRPTDDPSVFWPDRTGAVLPFGAHKGYGLAVACELLAGALTGNGTYGPGFVATGGLRNGLLAIVIDPTRLSSAGDFSSTVGAFIDYVKASPPADAMEPVLVAGDPERESRMKRLRDGVPVDAVTWREILDAGQTLNLEENELDALAASG